MLPIIRRKNLPKMFRKFECPIEQIYVINLVPGINKLKKRYIILAMEKHSHLTYV